MTEATTIIPVMATTSTSHNQHTEHSDSNLGMIIGVALGVPLVLILCGILAFCLYRRRRKSKKYSGLGRTKTPDMVANYNDLAPGSHAPELDSYPVATTKPNRASELYGSDTYKPSPTFSTGTSETGPPQYSPSRISPRMNQIQEEPQELWGGYVPYRPPRDEQGAEGGYKDRT